MTSISQPSMHFSIEDEITPFETSKGEQLKVRAKKKKGKRPFSNAI